MKIIDTVCSKVVYLSTQHFEVSVPVIKSPVIIQQCFGQLMFAYLFIVCGIHQSRGEFKRSAIRLSLSKTCLTPYISGHSRTRVNVSSEKKKWTDSENQSSVGAFASVCYRYTTIGYRRNAPDHSFLAVILRVLFRTVFSTSKLQNDFQQ